MNDIFIFKTADHVSNGIHTANVTQKFIAQSLAFTSAFHQTGNVYKFNGSG